MRASLVPFLLVLGSGAVQAQPPNDECSTAIPLVDGLNGPLAVAGATNNPAVPSFVCSGGVGVDLWFTYTTTCAGGLRFTTCAPATTSVPTVLGAYTGSCGALSLAGCPGSLVNFCGFGSEVIVGAAGPGQTFLLRVSMPASATGTFTLDVTCAPPPPNDECGGAIPLVDGLNTGFSTLGASATLFPPGGVCFDYQDVWFSYTASCTGSVTLGVCSPATGEFADYTILGAFTGTCGALDLHQCKGGGCFSTSEPWVSFSSVSAGETVFLRVGTSAAGVSGDFAVLASCQVPADDFGDAPAQVGIARHTNAGLGARLGTLVSLEATTVLPSWVGDAGDDGILAVSNLFPGSASATIVVRATNPAGTSVDYARIWVNRDGSPGFDLSEALPAQSASVGPGGTSFTFGPFPCPPSMAASPTVRVRLSSDAAGVSDGTGTAASGEVEDYVLPGTGGPATTPIGGGGGTDAGDAPLPYPPCNSTAITGNRLGLTITGDATCPVGFPTAGDAAWNDDAGDDGIVGLSGLSPGGSCSIVVQTLNPIGIGGGLLRGWIDFDGDGNWDEPGEAFAPISAGAQPFPQEWTLGPLAVPAGAVAPFPTRLKHYDTNFGFFVTSGEQVLGGEVEDYLLPSQSCTPCNTLGTGPPSLFALDPPRLDGPFALRTAGAWPATSVLTIFGNFSGPGVDLAGFGLPIAPGICFLCVLPQVFFGGGLTDGTGRLTQTFAIPSDPAFTGAPIRLQNVQILPAPGGLDVLITNAVATSVLPL